jgi:uncharacterized membrane-anchored protein YhcB (DUF1043 family)
MENQKTKQMKPIVKYALILIAGLVLGALLFSQCNGSQQKQSEVGTELKKQYEGLQNEYLKLQGHNEKINNELKLQFIKTEEANNKAAVEHKKYVAAYTKGRGDIINNPNNDSLHLAAYDTLNANCERVQARDKNVLDQCNYLTGIMQKKINNQDSTITNRNGVISLDKIAIASTRDSLATAKSEIRGNKKKVVKAFFIGVGVGAAAREAVNVGIKLFGK